MTGLRIALLIGFLASGARLARAEDITISTYYPSPRGGYQELRTTNNTYLAPQSGNVGIGTTAPGAKLAVIQDADFGLMVEGDGVNFNPRIALRRANSVGGTGNIDWVGNTNAVSARIGFNDSVGGSLEFKLGGSADTDTKLIIASSGNVGIGMTNPAAKLDVTGNGGTQVLLKTRVQPVGNDAGISLNVLPAPPGFSDSSIIFHSSDNVQRITFLGHIDSITTNDSLSIGLGVSPNVFVIRGTGNVGIGVVTPQATLHVGGNQGLADNRNFKVTYPAGGALANTELAGLANLQTDLGVGWSALYARQGAASYAAVVNGTSIFMNGNMSVGNGNVGVGTTNPTSISGLTPVVNISGTAPGILLTDTDDANGSYELYANSGQFIMTRNSGNPATDHPMGINRLATNSFGVALPGQSTNGVCHSSTGMTTDGLGDYLMDCNGAASDIAEWYDTEPDVELGDLVAVSDKTTAFEYASGIGTVLNDRGNPIENALFPGTKKSIAVLKKADGQSALIGIVSTAPYQTFGEDVQEKAKHPQRIALVGRAPVKVSTEHGPIQIGDRITLSSLPGVGMKAVEETSTIGIVLEAFDGRGAEAVSCGAYRCGKSLVFVNVGEGNLAAKVSTQQRQIEDLQSRLKALEANTGNDRRRTPN